MNLSLTRTMKTAIHFVLALSALLSAPAQAQSVVGNWAVLGAPWIVVGFQSNGRWSFTDSNPADAAECGGSSIAVGGSYTASGGAISMSIDSGGCGTINYSGTSISLGSGTYSISGNTLTAALSSLYGPINLVLTSLGTNTITPTTPLPPPPTTQSVFTIPSGQMPAQAVLSVTPSGNFGAATLVVKLDPTALSAGLFASEGQFAAGYNIYVGALAPAGVMGLSSPAWFVYPASKSWATLGTPIAAYLEGIAQGATNAIEIPILQNMNLTGLVGAEIYIGYGTSDGEMLNNKRYRGVYLVQ